MQCVSYVPAGLSKELLQFILLVQCNYKMPSLLLEKGWGELCKEERNQLQDTPSFFMQFQEVECVGITQKKNQLLTLLPVVVHTRFAAAEKEEGFVSSDGHMWVQTTFQQITIHTED